MTTVHINLEESLADAARQRAAAEGKTLESWLADMLAQQMTPPKDVEWVTRFLEGSERINGDSGGRKWSRDELYNE